MTPGTRTLGPGALHYRVPLMTVDAPDAAPSAPPAEGGTGRGRPDEDAVRHRVLATSLVVTTYVVLAVVVYWHAWTGGITTHMQLGGDQYSNVWFLRWTPFALLHGLDPLFSTYANYPFCVNLVTNTSAPLLGLLGLPVT